MSSLPYSLANVIKKRSRFLIWISQTKTHLFILATKCIARTNAVCKSIPIPKFHGAQAVVAAVVAELLANREMVGFLWCSKGMSQHDKWVKTCNNRFFHPRLGDL